MSTTDVPLEKVPYYSLAEAARYIGTPPSTVRSWFRGRLDSGENRQIRRRPIFPKAAKQPALTFLDLIDAHVLDTIRRGYRIPMKNVRKAIEFFDQKYSRQEHLFSSAKFLNDERHLYLEDEQGLISLSENGQHVSRELVQEGLRQIEYGKNGYACRFYPRYEHRMQREVLIDPQINYGRPVLASCFVGLEPIANRFEAGETISELAEDYSTTEQKIESAIRWHERLSRTRKDAIH